MQSMRYKPVCGVYLITCTKNKKRYVGSSLDIRSRWNKHKQQLRIGEHHNRHLQFSWNKYGERYFKLSVLEVTKPGIRISREIEWFDKIDPEFNAMRPDVAPQLWTFTPEVREECRKRQPANSKDPAIRKAWLDALKVAVDRNKPKRDKEKEQRRLERLRKKIESWPRSFATLISKIDKIGCTDKSERKAVYIEIPNTSILFNHMKNAFSVENMDIKIDKPIKPNNSNRGLKRSEEAKRRMSESHKKNWQDPEYKKNVLAAMHTPEYIEKQKNTPWNIEQRRMAGRE